MKTSFHPRRSPLRFRSLTGLLAISAASLLAQGTSTSSTTSGGSQADEDVAAARRAAASAGTGTSGTAGVGARGTGASGTGTAGTGAGVGARPDDASADAVDRSRERNLPGARPGDAPAQRPGGPAVAQPGPAVSELNPAIPSGGGTDAGSRPGAGLGGMPSGGSMSGGATTNGATSIDGGSTGAASTPRRDSRTTARMIGETSFAYRDRAMEMVDDELSSGGALGSSILRGAEGLSGAARTRVNDSITRANEARTELSKAVSRARSANESRWDSSRSEVVERYQAYVKALEDARAAAVESGVQLADPAGTSATIPAPQ